MTSVELSGKVALVTGSLQEGVGPRRVAGFREAMKANPQVQIVAVEDAKWQTDLSERIAGQLFARYAAQGGLDPRRIRVLPYPGDYPLGVVLVGSGAGPVTDEDDLLLTQPVTLMHHLEGVAVWSRRVASGCGRPCASTQPATASGLASR